MSFGWYQESLGEVGVPDLATAEARLLDMLDWGAMIVHVYRETDLDTPELVGRHGRLRSFYADKAGKSNDVQAHEIERFLLDPACLDAWLQAEKSNTLLDQRWSITELWYGQSRVDSSIYGKATLVTRPAPRPRPAAQT